jgi:Uncharacterised protein family (UPF0259)
MPGAVLRPLSLGEILDVSFGMYRALFTPLLVVTVATQAVPLVLSIYVQSAGGMLLHPWLYFASLLLSAVLSAIAAAASTFIVSESYLGHRITAGEAFQRATPFIGRLVSLAILTSFVVGLGFLLLFIPGLILVAGLILASPALVIEGLPRATDAMGRSWSLSRGYRWKLFGCLVVTMVLILLPVVALSGFAVATSVNPESLDRGISPFGLLWLTLASALQVLIYPMLYCVLTVAYYDLRVRKEAFDLEVMASGLTRAG